jgi:heme/copper-type cytochrome/quinol oxidase subunit 2
MPVVVIAKPKAEFEQWLAQQPGYQAAEDLASMAANTIADKQATADKQADDQPEVALVN